jgi:REP element-mobilizing transposase RayT
MEKPFALHITWTTFGTWLPGDQRGYVTNTVASDGGFQKKENTPGTPYTADAPFMSARARALQQRPTALLTASLARVAAAAMVSAATARGWRIVRGALMPNHIHMVVIDCPADGSAVRRVLKGTSQAALNREAGAQRWWTAGGSDRYKNDDDAIAAAIRYVANQPGKLVEIVDMKVQTVEARRG